MSLERAYEPKPLCFVASWKDSTAVGGSAEAMLKKRGSGGDSKERASEYADPSIQVVISGKESVARESNESEAAKSVGKKFVFSAEIPFECTLKSGNVLFDFELRGTRHRRG